MIVQDLGQAAPLALLGPDQRARDLAQLVRGVAVRGDLPAQRAERAGQQPQAQHHDEDESGEEDEAAMTRAHAQGLLQRQGVLLQGVQPAPDLIVEAVALRAAQGGDGRAGASFPADRGLPVRERHAALDERGQLSDPFVPAGPAFGGAAHLGELRQGLPAALASGAGGALAAGGDVLAGELAELVHARGEGLQAEQLVVDALRLALGLRAADDADEHERRGRDQQHRRGHELTGRPARPHQRSTSSLGKRRRSFSAEPTRAATVSLQ